MMITIHEQAIHDAETKGYSDRGRGYKRNDNPYKKGSELFRAWLSGWSECNDEFLADREYSQE